MKKSKFVMGIALVLCLVLVLGGCKGNKSAVKMHTESLTPVGEFPLVTEPVTLSVFAVKNSYISDFETNEFTKWYEEKTGVHLEWTVASGDAQQSFNLMIASGEYPDIIMGMGLNREQVASLAAQGILTDISGYIEEYGPNIKKLFENYPETKEYVNIDGAIYGLPHGGDSYTEKYKNMMWVYEPWLEKLGLEKPKTTDEFYEMLKAFKEKDPNGNGKADEIPLISRGVKNDCGIEAYLMSAFIPDDGKTRCYVENGEVKFVGTQPEFREGLRYLRKLYEEGLLYKDSFIIDRTQIMSLGENDTPVLGTAPGQFPGMFCLSNGTSERYYDYSAIAPLTGPEGVKSTVGRYSGVKGHNFIVTKECKYPDLAVRWIDWFYSEEGSKSQSDGTTITREAKEGELGYDGKQAKWAVDKNPEAEDPTYAGMAQNRSWKLFGAYYSSLERSIKIYNPHSTLDPDGVWYRAYEEYDKCAVDTYIDYRIIDECLTDYADGQMIIEEMEKYFAKFVLGELSIDKDWDSYVESLNKLGLQKYLKARQMSYDASIK